MTKLVFLSIAAISTACSATDSTERESSKLKEVEMTRQSGSTTTVQRWEAQYDGSHILELLEYLNGAPNGSIQYFWGGAGLERLEFTDKQGDRASDELTYTSSKLSREVFRIAGVLTRERMMKYANDGVLSEMTTNVMAAGSSADVTLTKYEYDVNKQLTKITALQGGDTDITELHYDVDRRLDRAASYSDGAHVVTYTFTYNKDGTLDEVTDTHNRRYSVSYDDSHRIAEVRLLDESTLTRYRYTYDSGSIEGISFAPAVPLSGQFDLDGNVYGNVELLHTSPTSIGDIPSATGSGGSGGGGGGSGDVCPTIDTDPTNACAVCLETNCCTQTTNCLPGTACDTYYECTKSCTDSTCVQTCRNQYPAGATADDAFVSCAQSYCSVSCQ
jgi:YD repeat-containing protein